MNGFFRLIIVSFGLASCLKPDEDVFSLCYISFVP